MLWCGRHALAVRFCLQLQFGLRDRAQRKLRSVQVLTSVRCAERRSLHFHSYVTARLPVALQVRTVRERPSDAAAAAPTIIASHSIVVQTVATVHFQGLLLIVRGNRCETNMAFPGIVMAV